MKPAGLQLGALYRESHGRVLGAVLARVRDFPLAEECVQEAFARAAEWGEAPPNPVAWLCRVATNLAIDQLRRRARFPEVAADLLVDEEAPAMPGEDAEIGDERLRLLFTCCHPALAPEAQVQLTLRAVAGLGSGEIARLFLVAPEAVAQRLVRAQRKIADARIPFAVPAAEALPERLASALAVVYLVFTDGHAAAAGPRCDEAIRLARLIVELLPGEAEARALLALLLCTDARRPARVAGGEAVRLEEQDRAQWDRAKIDEGLALLDRALAAGAAGPYALQAAIAALHARAARAEDTDWPQIAAIYDLLVGLQPTPQVELARAVAVAMARGADAGLGELDRLRFALGEDHLYHAARADLLARLGKRSEAARAYRAALARVDSEPERRFLARRLAEMV